jgi:spore coat protein CotF
MKLGVKEMISDMLQMEKSLAKAYCNAQLEAANKKLRGALGHMHNDIQENHARLFHEMHQRGWYQTPVAGQQAIESTLISWEQKSLKEPELQTKPTH